MGQMLSQRAEAEAVEKFGDDLLKLVKDFDRLCPRIFDDTMLEICRIPNQEHLSDIAEAYRKLGSDLGRACDAADDGATLQSMQGRDI